MKQPNNALIAATLARTAFRDQQEAIAATIEYRGMRGPYVGLYFAGEEYFYGCSDVDVDGNVRYIGKNGKPISKAAQNTADRIRRY